VAELSAIRYVVDENTLALGKVMAELRDDTAVIGLPPVDQLLRRGMNDIEWIPVVGARGWVVITIDHHLRTRPYEAHLALKHGLKCVNLRGAGNLSRWAQLVRLIRHWEALDEFVIARPDGPWWLSVTKTGRREYDYKSS
jgi:PIN domain-containing protein